MRLISSEVEGIAFRIIVLPNFIGPPTNTTALEVVFRANHIAKGVLDFIKERNNDLKTWGWGGFPDNLPGDRSVLIGMPPEKIQRTLLIFPNEANSREEIETFQRKIETWFSRLFEDNTTFQDLLKKGAENDGVELQHALLHSTKRKNCTSLGLLFAILAIGAATSYYSLSGRIS